MGRYRSKSLTARVRLVSRLLPSWRTTTDKGKPGVSRGRKATGLGVVHLIQSAGLPNGAAFSER
jgi:hypothetical protein